MVAKKPADEVLAVRVPPALKRELRELAQADNRSLSNLVEILLSQALASRQAYTPVVR
jgi:hypothetical protein